MIGDEYRYLYIDGCLDCFINFRYFCFYFIDKVNEGRRVMIVGGIFRLFRFCGL